MYKKILDELETLKDSEYAEWIRPLLSIHENSSEKILGIRVPYLRKLAKTYKEISLGEIESLLQSDIHELRLLAILIMILRVKKEPETILDLYLQNLDFINNWDLIDYSAPYIVAPNIKEEGLRELANSEYLWANRVAMISTIYYIKKSDFRLALEFAEKYINHSNHLIHKAAGWMLREVGKKDINVLIEFLETHSSKMPAIMRSYAREKIRKM